MFPEAIQLTMIIPPPTNKSFLGSVRAVLAERADMYWDAGNLVEGPRRHTESIKFNNAGDVTEVEIFEQGTLSSKTIYSYSGGGELIASASYNADGSTSSKTIYEYKDRSLTDRVSYDEAGVVVEKARHTYNADGKASEVLVYDASDALMRRWAFNFDSAGGHVDTRYDYDQNQTVKGSSVAVYDAGGRLVESTCYDANGKPVSKTLSVYDSDGNNIEQRLHDASGTLICKSVFGYDDSGRLTLRAEDYITNGTIEEYSYSYEVDDAGNWIKKTIRRVVPEPRQVSHPGVIIYRTFTYR